MPIATTKYVLQFSRPEDTFDTIRVECILQNYPADNNTLQLAEMGLNGVIATLSSASIFINSSEIISGKQFRCQSTYSMLFICCIILKQLLDSVMLKYNSFHSTLIFGPRQKLEQQQHYLVGWVLWFPMEWLGDLAILTQLSGTQSPSMNASLVRA